MTVSFDRGVELCRSRCFVLLEKYQVYAATVKINIYPVAEMKLQKLNETLEKYEQLSGLQCDTHICDTIKTIKTKL